MNQNLLQVLTTPLEKRINSIFYPKDIEKVCFLLGTIDIKKKKDNTKYYNIPCSFDIETTSFYKSNRLDKVAIMYEWTLCLNGYIIVGRTWNEFMYVYNYICDYLNLNENLRLIIYVHNLGFEFQFIRKRLDWDKVFSLEKRKPIKALTLDGVEFRCSYLLSGYSLDNLSNQLIKYKVKKLTGDLNYKLIRHSGTPLTDKELNYCVGDVLVVVAYIQELIEQYGDITKLPLTKTGFVRQYCRDCCLYNKENPKDTKKYHKFRDIMKYLTLDKETYLQLKRAFAGGFTHANPFYSRETLENVSSSDFTSSYPYVMISEKFPMSAPIYVQELNNTNFDKYLDKYCCLFDAEFINIESYEFYENYISKSHCRKLRKYEENNGRIVNAEHLFITLTEQDYFIIRSLYKWDNMIVHNFKAFTKSYLPKDLVLAILQLYYDKTTLKGVEGKEVEYLNSKERINAVYGMSVTDIVRDEISYNEDWISTSPNIDEEIDGYNKSVKRFLYYPWGVWVTAYARINLFTAIKELGNDYIYSDTDSVKYINRSNHLDYFNKYNEYVVNKLEYVMKCQGIDIELTRPKNIKGQIKQIGVWDYEGDYKRFKTLGAKRYLVENQDGSHTITVSGVNKKMAVKYLEENYIDIFDAFDDELCIPAESTGKLTHTYIDDEQAGYVKDYMGNKGFYNELSSVHLESAEYSLSINQVYADYLLNVKQYEK